MRSMARYLLFSKVLNLRFQKLEDGMQFREM